LGKKVVNTDYVKAFIDPDLAVEWNKFQKKYPYLFWVRAMNIKNAKKWREFLKGQEPDLECAPVLPGSTWEFAEIATARRNVYFHITRSFSEPSMAFVEVLLKGNFASSIESSTGTFVSESKTLEGLKLLREYLSHIKVERRDRILEKLRNEHLTIFYDSFFPWISCYESVYRGEKQIMGDLTAMVNESYKKAGFALTGKYGNDPSDDVKIELEFMYRLCEEELESWRKGDKGSAMGYLKMQRKHLHQHMIEWLPYLCDDLLKPEFRKGVTEKFHRTIEVRQSVIREFDFYRAVGAITKGVLECDYNQVQAMIEAGRGADEGEVASHLQGTSKMDIAEDRFALVKASR
jgi:TorA maturation chaperone TorD